MFTKGEKNFLSFFYIKKRMHYLQSFVPTIHFVPAPSPARCVNSIL
jgi:hypothetical protein